MTPEARAQLVKQLGRRLGFDLIGITHAGPVDRGRYYRDWLAAGHHGQMAYLARNVPIRVDPSLILADTRSIICVAINYRRHDGYLSPQDLPARQPVEAVGRVAQYARGEDYHVVIRRGLADLADQLREALDEIFEVRPCVDTAPVLERELAARAGLGWIANNTCLIHPQLGSYLLLGELFTTLDLATDEPGEFAGCARCRRCIDACPTGAIRAPRQLDARRCISYLTIEHREAIPSELHAALGDCVFGCDICQQVCPYNARAPLGTHPGMNTEHLSADLSLRRLLELRSADYRRLVARTAGRRARRPDWRRNAAIAAGNLRECGEDLRSSLRALAEDERDSVRAAARAALQKLTGRM